jgi:hypothetical protein
VRLSARAFADAFSAPRCGQPYSGELGFCEGEMMGWAAAIIGVQASGRVAFIHDTGW